MIRNGLFFIFTIFISIIVLSSCNSTKQNESKVERWELDSLKEISPETPVSTSGLKSTKIKAKWYISVNVYKYIGDSYLGDSNEKVCKEYSVEESEIDTSQYIVFNADGSFFLSAKNPCPEMKQELESLFPEIYHSNDIIQGTYKCYDVDWYGGECNGSYGVVLFDTQGHEINRFAFSYCSLDGEAFHLNRVYMKDPNRDDIRSQLSFILHKNLPSLNHVPDSLSPLPVSQPMSP